MTDNTTTFVLATADDFAQMRALLMQNGLPTDDLTPKHRTRFIVCRVGKELAGMIWNETLLTEGLFDYLRAIAP